MKENKQIHIIEQSLEENCKSIDNAKDDSQSKVAKPYNNRL